MTADLLTAARLQNFKPPASGFLELRDKLARGLSLRVFSSGRATWTFRYRPKDGGARTRIVIGEFPNVGLAAARDRADRMRAVVSGGGDPQRELQSRREAPTLADLIERYLVERVKPKKKPRTLVALAHMAAPYVHPRQGYAAEDESLDDFVPLDERIARLDARARAAMGESNVVNFSGEGIHK